MNFLDLSPKKYKISGSINFFIEVSIQGQLPYHTSVISINTHSKTNRKDVIGSNFKWFRFTDSTTYQMTDMVSNTHITSPTDIGYKLRCEVTPKEEGFEGVGIIDFGPIKLDPTIRNTLEGILSVGGSSFPASLINDNLNKMNSDLNLFLTNDTIRIVRTYDQESFKFCYSAQNPQIEIASRDLSFLSFSFNEPQENKLMRSLMKGNKFCLKMTSRISRDLLLLSIQCFALKNYLINSKIITSIENGNNIDSIKFFKDKDNGNSLMGDLLLELNLLKQENSMLLDQNKMIRNEKEAFSNQVKNLEQEIIETIDTYTKLITDIKENGVDIKLDENILEKTKKDIINKKMRSYEEFEKNSNEISSIKKVLFKDEHENEINELQHKNANLTIEINSLRAELQKMQKPTDASLQDYLIKLDIVTQENISLKQTQQKYYELLSKYRELDDKFSLLLKTINHNNSNFDNGTNKKYTSLQNELLKEKENNKKLNDDLKLLSLQFSTYRKNNTKTIVEHPDNESLINMNKQMNKKIECLQKELENKGNSLIIEQLTKTNTKFLLENQKLVEELQRKNDEISIQGIPWKNEGPKDVIMENKFLKERLKELEYERDKLLVDYSKLKKH